MSITIAVFLTLVILTAPVVIILFIAACFDEKGGFLLAILVFPFFVAIVYAGFYLFGLGTEYLIDIWRSVVC